METVSNRHDEFKRLLENLIASGIDQEVATKYIEDNIEILTSKEMDVNDSLYFLLNNEDIYGIIYVDGDTYYWSNYRDGELTNLKTLMGTDETDLTSYDYIIDMVINFANSAKMRRILPAIENYSVENKLKALKEFGLNKNGYHIK